MFLIKFCIQLYTYIHTYIVVHRMSIYIYIYIYVHSCTSHVYIYIYTHLYKLVENFTIKTYNIIYFFVCFYLKLFQLYV